MPISRSTFKKAFNFLFLCVKWQFVSVIFVPIRNTHTHTHTQRLLKWNQFFRRRVGIFSILWWKWLQHETMHETILAIKCCPKIQRRQKKTSSVFNLLNDTAIFFDASSILMVMFVPFFQSAATFNWIWAVRNSNLISAMKLPLISAFRLILRKFEHHVK